MSKKKPCIHISIYKSASARKKYREWNGIGKEPKGSVADYVASIPLDIDPTLRALNGEPAQMSYDVFASWLSYVWRWSDGTFINDSEKEEAHRILKFGFQFYDLRWLDPKEITHVDIGKKFIAVVWED